MGLFCICTNNLTLQFNTPEIFQLTNFNLADYSLNVAGGHATGAWPLRANSQLYVL